MKRLALVAAVLLTAGLTTAALAATAEENYKNHCLKCHGEDGDGRGPAADVLDVPAGDFTDCEHMKSLSDDYLIEIMKGGGQAVGKSVQMPAAGKIPEEEYPALAEYIRSFCEE